MSASSRACLSSSAGRSGFTLTEIMIAMALLTGIGYVLALSMRTSATSHSTVVNQSTVNFELRGFATTLRSELRCARGSSIDIVDGPLSSTLTLETAIQGAGGVAAWGAFDRRLAVDEAECHQPGWRIRYEVVPDGNGSDELVRSIVDQADEVHLSESLATGVESFRIEEVDDVWVVRLRTRGRDGMREDELDVRTRIQ